MEYVLVCTLSSRLRRRSVQFCTAPIRGLYIELGAGRKEEIPLDVALLSPTDYLFEQEKVQLVRIETLQLYTLTYIMCHVVSYNVQCTSTGFLLSLFHHGVLYGTSVLS